MGDVVILPVITTLDLPPDGLLEAAKGKLTEVVILGFTEDGDEYFASSKGGAGDVLYHLERAKYNLMKMTDDLTE